MKKKDRIKVWEKYNHHCAYCGREIKLEDMQIDHFFPKNRGNYSRWSDKEGKYIVSHGEDSMENYMPCLLYTSPSPRDRQKSRMPSSA